MSNEEEVTTEQETPAAAPPEPTEAPEAVAGPASAEPNPEEFEPVRPRSLGPLVDVPLTLTVEVGSARMLVREVLQINEGSVIPLDRNSGDRADILVNGRLIARGEVTTLDDSLAIRVVELIGAGAAAAIAKAED